MNKRIAIGTILVFGSLLAAACNLPFGGEEAEPEAQLPAAEAPDEQPAAEVVSVDAARGGHQRRGYSLGVRG